ncbi:MAG TPA: uracil-DNA glycosylase, partial [Ramlibacter sp.]|nr:uracil-DNA glycosylase [Ramlibacter sp.]
MGRPAQASLLAETAGADRLTEWAPERWPVAAGWRPVIDTFLRSPEGQRLSGFMRGRLAAGAVVYPPRPFR